MRLRLVGVTLILLSAAAALTATITADADAQGDRAAGNFPRLCPDIYNDALFPTFEVDLSEPNLARLMAMFTRWSDFADPKQYVGTTSFRYGNETHTGVEIRLRGNPPGSWSPRQEKMQFVIKFLQGDHFHGVRRLALDAPQYDPSLLRERMATHYAHDLGLVARCTNHARLNINGKYYGVYTNIEMADEMYLARNFPAPLGALWKNGTDLEEGTDDGAMRKLQGTVDVPNLMRLGDLDQWVKTWAFEAVILDMDGYWCFGHNYLNYYYPGRGWLWLADDLDATLDHAIFDNYLHYAPPDAGMGWATPDPLTCKPIHREPTIYPKHLWPVLANADYARKYTEALAAHLARYDVPLFERRLDAWAAQIKMAVLEDPNKPYTTDDHGMGVERVRTHIKQRKTILMKYLAK